MIPYVAPSVTKMLEPLYPMPFAAAFHVFHVVPAGMTGKGEKVQMGAGDIETVLQRPDAVSRGVEVTEVAEKILESN